MRSAIVLSALLATLGAAPLLNACAGTTKPTLHIGAMPSGGTFTGVWFSPQYGEMHFEQNGATVIGRYEKDERHGRVQGSVEGDILRFEWTESRELIAGRATKTRGHGYFRISHSDADDTWNVTGEWGNDDSETGGGQWTAVKSKTRKPNVGTRSESPSKSSPGDEDGSKYGGEDVAAPENDLSGL
ncbi:MAG: hypothetical protein RL385_1224 [Pseudomonadota bacterium]|jgi:hypothetical protein